MLLRLFASAPTPTPQLVLVHDVCDPLTGLVILIVNHFCPLPLGDIVSFSYIFCHYTFVQHVTDDFCSDLVYTYGTFFFSFSSFWCSLSLMNILSVSSICNSFNLQLWHGISFTTPQIFDFYTVFRISWNGTREQTTWAISIGLWLP